MNAECQHCDTARKVGWHGGYSTGCQGCMARSLARSLVMFNAVKKRTPEAFADLRDAITRVLPGQPYEAARAAVLAWWNHDHPKGS